MDALTWYAVVVRCVTDRRAWAACELCYPCHSAGLWYRGGRGRQLSPTSSQNNPKETHNLMVGAQRTTVLAPRCSTPARAAVMARAQRHPHRRPDAEKQICADEVHTFNSLLQYYDGEADMPVACLARITTPIAGNPPARMTLLGSSQAGEPGLPVPARQPHKFNIQGFYTQTLRSGYLEQANASPSRRVTTGCAVLSHAKPDLYDRPFRARSGRGLSLCNESTHEMRYYTATSSGQLPSAQALTTAIRVPAPRRTPGI